MNADGAWREKDKVGGIEVIIRDEKGAFLAGFAKKIEAVLFAQAVEAYALREGLNLALESRFKSLEVEGDAQPVIKCLQKRGAMVADLEVVCTDIFHLARKVNVVKFVSISRNCNQTVDAIAKYALGLESLEVWLETPPSWLEPFLVEDCSSVVY
ncbi:hypothetical protein L1049_013208 [Liquidambar formosana]|uniref:RNase H type-1 domain-containing protein n=1 Tax=Liquidambar formosana TaxID=63359 RepID=A0AAP0RMY8_LIQFO